jgi:hypothetical protein
VDFVAHVAGPLLPVEIDRARPGGPLSDRSLTPPWRAHAIMLRYRRFHPRQFATS